MAVGPLIYIKVTCAKALTLHARLEKIASSPVIYACGRFGYRFDEDGSRARGGEVGGNVVDGDLIIGIIGAFIGDWLLPRIGIHLGTGIVSAFINATIGAVLLLLVVRLLRGGGRFGGGWADADGGSGREKKRKPRAYAARP